jgi:hypothetical protein
METKNFFSGAFYMIILIILSACSEQNYRSRSEFNENWKFHLGDSTDAQVTILMIVNGEISRFLTIGVLKVNLVLITLLVLVEVHYQRDGLV